MNTQEVENSIQGMRDVGTMLYMMDEAVVGKPEICREHLERSFYLLRDLFQKRMAGLDAAFYGGDAHAG